MNETDIIKGRLKDLANSAYRQNRYTYTNFLNAADMEIFYNNIEQLSFAGYKIYGGRDMCDRVMIAFGNEDLLGYTEDFPIATIKISALLDKYADDLNHRDFLGALMNLGISRDMIGDILVSSSNGSGKHTEAYVFCCVTVADYIVENLTKIKHTNVKCALCSAQDTQKIQIQKENIHVIAASPRIDAVISALLGMSRSNTATLFTGRKVTLNQRLYENSSYQLKPGDIFSVKGYGKYEFIGKGTETRKGRLNIDLMKYT